MQVSFNLQEPGNDITHVIKTQAELWLDSITSTYIYILCYMLYKH